MKKRKFLAAAAVTLMIAVLFVSALTLTSCDNGNDPAESSTESVPADTLPPVPEDTGITVAKDKATEYRLIRPANCESSKLLNKCNDLGDAINKYMLIGSGNYIYADRDNNEATEYEILVGATNRPESAEVLNTLKAGDYTVRFVNKKLVIIGKEDTDSVAAVEWFIKNFINGSDSLVLPEDFCYNRSEAPYILELDREEYYWDLSTNSPEIRITVMSPDLKAPELVRFAVDDRDVTSQVSADGNFLTLSGVQFDNGMHTAQIIMKSSAGKLGYEIFHFGCGECENMNLYKGEVHAHTTDSDGTGTAEEAYKYARDNAKLDFFAVTDHSNSYAEANYQKNHIPLADKFNEPGKFVALYGYEETYNNTTGYFGHLNTLNTSVYALRAEPLEVYYKKMAKASGAIVQFNHPGYSWGNFLEYDKYSPVYDSVVNLYEFKGSGYDNEWALCLAKGWHVSPMHNEDNHSGQWGTVNEAVGYVLAPSLTRQNITEAMTMNRSYTTTDQSLKIYFRINDVWMGGRLDNPDELKVSVNVKTSKANGLGTVSIVAEDNVVVASNACGTKKELNWELTLTPEYDYYYVKVNGSYFAVTAPVWVENRDKLNITGMDRKLISYDNGSAKDHRVSVSFKAEEAMTDVTVRFYQSALDGFNVTNAKAIGETKIGSMAAGASSEAYADADFQLASPRITAIVTGKIGDKVYSDTYYIQLTPLLFTEISGSANGYSYVEIYNATADPIDLSKYGIRMWPKTGAKSDALTANTFKMSGTVQPHSVMVVWLRTNKSTSLASFNSKYKSNLEENKDVVIVDSSWGAPLTRGIQIEILSGSTVISRAQYNFGTNTADVAECKSVLFTYQNEYTLTAVRKETMQAPTPGTFNEKYMPALIDKAS